MDRNKVIIDKVVKIIARLNTTKTNIINVEDISFADLDTVIDSINLLQILLQIIKTR